MLIFVGCDYTTTIRGIGPKTAFELIQKHKSIDEILEHLDKQKHPVGEEFQYAGAADLFLNAPVNDVSDLNLQWKAPDQEGLIQFLCEEKGFNQERVQAGIKRILEARKHYQRQRLENWFTVKKPDFEVKNPAKVAAEKRAAEAKAKAAAEKAKARLDKKKAPTPKKK